MIKSLFNIFGIFSPSAALPEEVPMWGIEEFVEHNKAINSNIKLISHYSGALGNNQRGSYLDAEASRYVRGGDFLVLVIASYKGEIRRIPPGFVRHIQADHNDHLSVAIYYKVHHHDESPIFRIYKDEDAENCFASLLTLRGPDMAIDSAGYIDTCGGDIGMAMTPRIKTAEDGALLSVFAYGDPLEVNIEDQHTLTSFVNNGKGYAIGIGETFGGVSRSIKAFAENSVKGNGYDIAVALSIF